MSKQDSSPACGPDYFAMASAILKIAGDLREQAAETGNQIQLEQAERLEQIADSIQAGAACRTL
ncbi:MAG: hypothetical protein KDE14_01115 [Rhodobacteraceae bacterium]|nr:hypothetical protein [Paracoccaceae bacterium]